MSGGRVWHPVCAALYDRMTATMEREILAPRRASLLGGLEGRVLDVGAGTGANLPHYRRAARVVATEPDAAMRRRLTRRLGEARVPVDVTGAAAEALPFADASFDAVVFTCVLCTVADPDAAVAEARRVLAPGGRVIVLEHVRGHGRLARWQDRVTPLWSRLMAGCHPNRDSAATLERAGFAFERLERFDPFPGPVPTRPMIEGIALARGG